MKSRLIWGAILLAAFAAFYYVTIRPAVTPLPERPRGSVGNRTPLVPERPSFTLPESMLNATIPTPVFPTPREVNIRVEPPTLKMEVPIQDGATIDFSIGAPVVRSGGEDTLAIEKALKEMEAATKDTKFGPTKQP
jgi:hypothetical protein